MRAANRIRPSALLAAFALGAAALLASCESVFSNDQGLLSSIQQEKEQVGTKVFKNTAAKKAFRLGDNYYASTSMLYTRAAGDDSWSAVDIDDKEYTLLDVATDGSAAVYASLTYWSGGAEVNALYYSADSCATWTALTGIPDGAIADALYCANGNLFAEIHENYASEIDTDHTYSLYYLDGTALAACASALQSKALPFIGAVWDSGQSRYWFATRGDLFMATTPSGAATNATPSDPDLASKTITSIYYSAYDSALYVGISGAYVYQCLGASTWTRESCGSGGPIAAIYSMGAAKLLVGEGTTDTYDEGGYYEGAYGSFSTGEDGDETLSSSVYSTTVEGTAVNSFFWDATAQTLFICVYPGPTSSLHGLYSTTYADGAWTGWDAE